MQGMKLTYVSLVITVGIILHCFNSIFFECVFPTLHEGRSESDPTFVRVSLIRAQEHDNMEETQDKDKLLEQTVLNHRVTDTVWNSKAFSLERHGKSIPLSFGVLHWPTTFIILII